MLKYILIFCFISLGTITAQESSVLRQLFLGLPIDSNLDSLINSINNNESIESDSSFQITFDTRDCKIFQGKFTNHKSFEHLTKNTILVYYRDSVPPVKDDFNVELIFDFKEFREADEDIMVKEYEHLKKTLSGYFESIGDETEIFAGGAKEIVSSEFKVDQSKFISLYYSNGGCMGPPILVLGFSKK
jgi:hypothetical protein